MTPLEKYGLTKAAYSIRELLEIVPLGRTRIYELHHEGRLPILKIGSKSIVTAAAVARLLDSLESLTPSEIVSRPDRGSGSPVAEATDEAAGHDDAPPTATTSHNPAPTAQTRRRSSRPTPSQAA